MRGTPWIFNSFRNNTIEQHGQECHLVSLRGNDQMFSERFGSCGKFHSSSMHPRPFQLFSNLPSLSGHGLRTIVLKSKLFLYSSKKLFLLLGCVTSVIYFKRIAIKILRNLGRKFEKFRIIIRDTPPMLLKRRKCRNVGSHVLKEKLTTLNYIPIAKLLLDRARTEISIHFVTQAK